MKLFEEIVADVEQDIRVMKMDMAQKDLSSVVLGCRSIIQRIERLKEACNAAFNAQKKHGGGLVPK